MGHSDLAPAAPDEWILACRLALGHSPADELESRAERLCAVVQRGDFDPAGLIVARRAGVPVGAIAAQVLPGGTGVLLPPFGADPEYCDALVRAALDHFGRSDVSIAHCALGEDEAALAAPLLNAGFGLVTQLLHMVRHGSFLPESTLQPPSALNFLPYSAELESAFGATLLRTYIGSFDLPEATVDRPASQLLTGYRHGQPDPPRWWLVETVEGEPVGVVILNVLDASGSLEVGYAGIVPERRRKGYGRALILHAIAESERAGILDLGLSVDARNAAAVSLYRGCLFRVYGSQDLYLMRLAPRR